ncbi:MAG: HAD family phosphatase [Clostridia bacterium]|nr:HAD family phosphatase [Clostridia bacterium]
MIQKKYKALISDFDGTLACTDKTVTRENLKAINELFSQGKKFALCTGRMTTSALMLAQKLPFKPLIATYNGGEIVDSATGEILSRHVLEPEIMLKLIDYGRERGLYYQIFTDEVIVEKITEVTEFYCSICKVRAVEVGDLKEYILREQKGSPKLMLINFKGDVNTYIEEINEIFGSEVEAVRCYEGMIDVTSLGVNKGLAVKDLSKIWGITPQDCVAVGDEGNDVAMFKVAGVGACMVNAREEVKKHADYVTKNNNDESGVAEVIQKFLIEEKL